MNTVIHVVFVKRPFHRSIIKTANHNTHDVVAFPQNWLRSIKIVPADVINQNYSPASPQTSKSVSSYVASAGKIINNRAFPPFTSKRLEIPLLPQVRVVCPSDTLFTTNTNRVFLLLSTMSVAILLRSTFS
jgi:hypothetical protein